MFESFDEIVCDQPPDLLCLEVIRVVVTVREHVRPDENAAPDLGTEAFGARAEIHVGEVAVLVRAMAVAHAVEARQVRRGLGGRDDVVRRHREAAVRQSDGDALRAELLELLERRLHGLAHVGGQPLAEMLLRHADAQARERLLQIPSIVFADAFDRGRIARIEPGHDVEKQREVFGAFRDRAPLVEAGGEGDHAR